MSRRSATEVRVLRRWLAGIALGSALVVLVSCARTPAPIGAVNSRKAAPGFTLSDSKGAAVRLSDYKGRVVLLNFWATWCHGCKVEIPWFMEFANQYQASGLTVIGVSLDADGWKSVKPYLDEKKINYTVVVGNDDLAKLYQVDNMPKTLLIDRDGKIAAAHSGMVDRAGCEGEIRELIRESATKAAM